jgi:ABC-type multidrug transport system permease subunit
MREMAQLAELTRARMKLFIREPEAVFWVFVFPVVLALVLGLAFQGRGQEPSRVGVIGAGSPCLAALEADPMIEVQVFEAAPAAAARLRSGAIEVLVDCDGDGPRLEYDAARTESVAARLRVRDALEREAGRVDQIEIREREVTERGSRYIDFLLPGLLGMNLMGTGMWGTGFAVVDWRQKKLLKLFMVTPMRRSWFLLAQVLSRGVFLVAEVAVIVAFGVFVLKVPFRGDLASFSLVCVVGAASFSGLGLLVASRAETVEGVSGIMNFVMMPMWLASGVFFSYERFPEFLLPLIRLLPLTGLNDALRASMLEGAGVAGVGMQLVLLAAWALLTFALALRIFRWR